MEYEERLKAALADRYTIDREIGAGGMATVYLAQDLKHERKVAVKVLDPELAENLGAERFLREIKTAANLSHPHILPLFDSGEADGFLFYVMPYVKGESLRARLTTEKQLPVEDAIQITREIADALAYAHEEGVIHRDVKPANIMLDAGHAVLADFGVAHAVAQAKDVRITRTGTSLGTPAYMSPEQAMGEEDLDGRSDQYALGCVLFEMLAGHPPFTGAQVEAVVRQHLTEQPPSVTQARPSVAEEVVKVINQALSKSPADRFKTTGEMAAALALTTTPKPAAPAARSRKGGTKALVYGGIAVVALAIAIVSLRPSGGSDPGDDRAGTGEVEDIAAALNRRPSIAVLPFANLSDLSENQYFADGIQNELLTHLQRVPGLKVISRTSGDAYRDTDKTIPEIGQELEVGYLLEGSVQRTGDQVRINVQLVDARSEGHLWADTYDRVLTPEGLLDIQSEIVRTVAGELNVALRSEEGIRAARRSTTDLEALDLYMRGQALVGEGRGEESLLLFQQALDLDSGFVLAHAALAAGHARLYQYRGQRSEERAAAAKAGAERAVELAPESEDAQLAMGIYLYRVEKNYQAALDWLGRASGTLVGDYDYHEFGAFAERRMGRWREAVESHEAALSLSPRDAITWREAGVTYLVLRRYAEAEEALRESLGLDPDQEMTLYYLGLLTWFRDGTTDGFGPYLAHFSGWFGWELAMTNGHIGDATAIQQDLPEIRIQQYFWYPKALAEAEMLEALGEGASAREKFREAAGVLELQLQETPDDERCHAGLAWAYAGLGRRDEAVAEGQTARDLMSRERDALGGPFFLFELAAVHAKLGETEEALEVLEDLLSKPARFAPNMLEDHFRLRPIQDDPQFKALMDRERDKVF